MIFGDLPTDTRRLFVTPAGLTRNACGTDPLAGMPRHLARTQLWQRLRGTGATAAWLRIRFRSNTAEEAEDFCACWASPKPNNSSLATNSKRAHPLSSSQVDDDDKSNAPPVRRPPKISASHNASGTQSAAVRRPAPAYTKTVEVNDEELRDEDVLVSAKPASSLHLKAS